MSWREDETQAFEESSEVERELERYVGRVHGMPSADFVDHVMSAVERAPAPRRGIIGALLGIAPGLHRPLQATALVAVVVIAAGGALAAAELLGGIRNSASPPATPSLVPSASPTPTPLETVSPTPTPSPTPSPTDEPSPTARETERPTAPTAEASETERPETPKPNETTGPFETPEASDDHGGGGIDSSGPGGGSDDSSPSPGS